MPRKPRIYVAGMPCHVIQRGNNRRACFFALDDYRQYLAFLKNARRRYRVAVHAYALMSNHAHLLMKPKGPTGSRGSCSHSTTSVRWSSNDASVLLNLLSTKSGPSHSAPF
jgi:REP element-mobilizing transposase RayT